MRNENDIWHKDKGVIISYDYYKLYQKEAFGPVAAKKNKHFLIVVVNSLI